MDSRVLRCNDGVDARLQHSAALRRTLAISSVTRSTVRSSVIHPGHIAQDSSGRRCIVVTAAAAAAENLKSGEGAGSVVTREIHPGIAKLCLAKQALDPITGSNVGALVKQFTRLQNGSDIRGIAVEGVADQPLTLTPGCIFFIGQAFARWLQSKGNASPSVSVGGDPRVSGPLMESALLAGLITGGATAQSFGLATTPCMFYSILDSKFSGSIMITASHMPYNSNGLKFFTKDGGLDKTDISSLLQDAARSAAEAGVAIGQALSEQSYLYSQALLVPPTSLTRFNFLPRYAAFMRQLIKDGVRSKTNFEFPLLGYKIVVDAGNGSGGFFASQVLAPLGADTNGSQFLDPDGTFPNHIPNPENAAAMAAGCDAVKKTGADLGIVFDTDVDRSAVIDQSGQPINSNRYIALMAAIVLRDHPGTTVVTDSTTSNGLGKFIAKLGGKHFRYRRGYKNVIGQGVKLNKEGVETHLMMETSGHGAMKENHYLDDGAYLAVQVVIELVRRRQAGAGELSDLLADLEEALESAEVRIKIGGADYKDVGSKVLEKFHGWVTGEHAPAGWSLEEVNHEGWRINVDEGQGKSGWLLLRQSLHDPLLVLNVESNVAGGAAARATAVSEFLAAECSGMPLDLSGLQKLK